MTNAITRRRFLQQSFAFSALAAAGIQSALASSLPSHHGASDVLMVGDWGWDGSSHTAQTNVALAMRRYAQEEKLRTQALFMLGDNWYGDLTGGADSPRWQAQFEQMYATDLFDCPAYAVLGNHDYQYWLDNKVEAQLEYARRSNTRWTMPARWYRFEFPATNPQITFLALDSNMPFADGSPRHGRDFALTPAQQAEQLAWLETQLQHPRTTPFLAVLAHHPVYSNGPHGDHPVLVHDWDPLLRKYKVDLYLAGHDHDLQHLEFEGHPTSFFLSGGGGADLYPLKIEPAQRGPYGQGIYGFSHLSVTGHELTLRHLDSDGGVLHAFRKTAQNAVVSAK
jgi:predicted MPP superfamily phosphohydrolase